MDSNFFECTKLYKRPSEKKKKKEEALKKYSLSFNNKNHKQAKRTLHLGPKFCSPGESALGDKRGPERRKQQCQERKTDLGLHSPKKMNF